MHRAHLDQANFAPVVDAVMRQAGLNVARDRWDVRRGGAAHFVINMEGRLSVRVAKTPDTGAKVARRAETLRRLPTGLSFAVPRPITRTITRNGMTAVGLHWIKGEPKNPGPASPKALSHMLRDLHSIDYTGMEPYLDQPHCHWGGQDWVGTLQDDVVPQLLRSNRPYAHKIIENVLELEPMKPRLIHNDLAGHNILWNGDRLVGLIDWDHACIADPAYDWASLGNWYGWDSLKKSLSSVELERAKTISRKLALEAVAYSMHNGMGGAIVRLAVERADNWLMDHREEI
ncbi:phosphotransferase [uncultured Rothia sp.]|uniref:phosphotransferase n=1 Tax=uncultured Rothia sp. TaxID=316088 RepID=UPI0011A086E0